MGFSIRVMPGVRIRASSRGFSAGIGPRAARVNVSSRSAGISTGGGPFTADHRLGGGGARRRAGGGGYAYGPTKREIAAIEREQRRQEKEAEIEEVEREAASLVKAHLETFPLARPPKAPDPAPVDVE